MVQAVVEQAHLQERGAAEAPQVEAQEALAVLLMVVPAATRPVVLARTVALVEAGVVVLGPLVLVVLVVLVRSAYPGNYVKPTV